MDSLPSSVLAGLDRSMLILLVAAAFAVLLPVWLIALFRRSEGDSLPLPRLLLGTATLAGLLLVPFLALGMSMLIPAGPATVAKAASAPPPVAAATREAPAEKPVAIAAPVTATPISAVPISSPTPAPTSTPRPRPTSTPVPPAVESAGVSAELAARGETIFGRERCVACHSIDGQGGTIGPDLLGVASRRTEKWIMDHFHDPQAISPGTLMPKFNLPDEDFQALTAYLLSLKRR